MRYDRLGPPGAQIPRPDDNINDHDGIENLLLTSVSDESAESWADDPDQVLSSAISPSGFPAHAYNNAMLCTDIQPARMAVHILNGASRIDTAAEIPVDFVAPGLHVHLLDTVCTFQPGREPTISC